MAGEAKPVRVHYRTAKFFGADGLVEGKSLEEAIRNALLGPLGDDYTSRAFKVWDGHLDEVMINESETTPPGVLLEIHHLDGRKELAFLKKEEHQKTAKILSRQVPAGENAMNASAYMLIIGNHIASIEPIALKSTALQSYFTTFLQQAGECGAAEYWKLEPKVQVSDEVMSKRGVQRLEIKPIARLVGDGPSTVVQEGKKKHPKPSVKTEERNARGETVMKVMQVLGASSADLDDFRSKLSNDLGLEAKIEIRVKRNNQKTTAEVQTEDLSLAIASLEQNNTVAVVSPDGKHQGKMTTLAHTMHVLEVDGIFPLQNVMSALKGALLEWSARGIIDLSGHI